MHQLVQQLCLLKRKLCRYRMQITELNDWTFNFDGIKCLICLSHGFRIKVTTLILKVGISSIDALKLHENLHIQTAIKFRRSQRKPLNYWLRQWRSRLPVAWILFLKIVKPMSINWIGIRYLPFWCRWGIWADITSLDFNQLVISEECGTDLIGLILVNFAICYQKLMHNQVVRFLRIQIKWIQRFVLDYE